MHKVAILGAGIGAQHAEAFKTLSDRYDLAVICDADESKGRALAEAYGADYTARIDTVLAEEQIDLVDICLPPHLHFSVAVQALQAGKHVICEKPLVASLQEADALAEAAARAERHVFPVFQYRYGLGMAQLSALVEAGCAGRCYAATLETHWNRDAAYYAVDWRGTWAGEQGGAILGHAIHIHDMLPAILGPVARVYAELSTRVNDIEVEDCAALAIKMASGACVTSSVTLGAADNRSRLKILFEGFTVTSDEMPYAPASAPWRFVARAPIEQARLDQVLDRVSGCLSGYQGLFSAISTTLSGLSSNSVTLEDGRRSIEFVTAVYASARTGHPMDLPLAKTHPFYSGWLNA